MQNCKINFHYAILTLYYDILNIICPSSQFHSQTCTRYTKASQGKAKDWHLSTGDHCSEVIFSSKSLQVSKSVACTFRLTFVQRWSLAQVWLYYQDLILFGLIMASTSHSTANVIWPCPAFMAEEEPSLFQSRVGA